MKLPKTLAIVLALAGTLLVSSKAEADFIFLRTGVDAALNVLGENATDPFWNISVQSLAATDAEVVNAEVICCGMQTVGDRAAWISDPSVTKGSPGTSWGIGLVAVASINFVLDGYDLDTVQLSGIWRVADLRQGVYINGNLIPGSNDGDNGWDNDEFVFAQGPEFFVDGLNTLELRGTSINSQFDGFWFDGGVDGVLEDVDPSPVPEPGTVSMMAFGVAGLIVHLRRRRAARS
jgi:hypothetical protein